MLYLSLKYNHGLFFFFANIGINSWCNNLSNIALNDFHELSRCGNLCSTPAVILTQMIFQLLEKSEIPRKIRFWYQAAYSALFSELVLCLNILTHISRPYLLTTSLQIVPSTKRGNIV